MHLHANATIQNLRNEVFRIANVLVQGSQAEVRRIANVWTRTERSSSLGHVKFRQIKEPVVEFLHVLSMVLAEFRQTMVAVEESDLQRACSTPPVTEGPVWVTTTLAVERLLVHVLENSMAFRVPDRPMVVFPHSADLARAHHPLDICNGISGYVFRGLDTGEDQGGKVVGVSGDAVRGTIFDGSIGDATYGVGSSRASDLQRARGLRTSA